MVFDFDEDAIVALAERASGKKGKKKQAKAKDALRTDWTLEQYRPTNQVVSVDVFRLIDEAFTSTLALKADCLGTKEDDGRQDFDAYFDAVREILKERVADVEDDEDDDEDRLVRRTILAKLKYVYTPHTTMAQLQRRHMIGVRWRPD